LAAAPVQDVDLWALYDRITCPTLLLRGAESNLLTAAIAHEMTTRGPHAKLVEFAGVGHAPPLMAEDQIAVVRDFLVSN
jgi:pimeloyl-ACP methyl ester carboxylesterase